MERAMKVAEGPGLKIAYVRTRNVRKAEKVKQVLAEGTKWALSTSGEPSARIEEMYVRAFSRRPGASQKDGL